MLEHHRLAGRPRAGRSTSHAQSGAVWLLPPATGAMVSGEIHAASLVVLRVFSPGLWVRDPVPYPYAWTRRRDRIELTPRPGRGPTGGQTISRLPGPARSSQWGSAR